MRFIVCETVDQVRLGQALRYEVYCIEKGWIDPSTCDDGLETDEYDRLAVHFLALDDEGTPVGTSRLLLGSRQILPAAKYLNLSSHGIAPGNVAEVSRLAAHETRRSQDLKVFLGLTKLMWVWGNERSMEACAAIADVPLFGLLTRLGLPVISMAPPIDYLGSKCIPVAFDVPGMGPALDRRGAGELLAS
jgi:N-acyl-L-homoserine lactone synthetase